MHSGKDDVPYRHHSLADVHCGGVSRVATKSISGGLLSLCLVRRIMLMVNLDRPSAFRVCSLLIACSK